MALTKSDFQQIQSMIDINNDELEERFEKVATKIKSDFIEEIESHLGLAA